MAILGIGLIVLILIGFIQSWLSSRRNSYFGMIIPLVNIISSTILAMMPSDYFVAFYVLIVTLSPLVIWLGIYKICRHRVEKKIQKNMNLIKIKDMR